MRRSQDRTHNDANEISAITATTGPNWVDPTHDAAGNRITGPTPGDETSTQKYVYDAWNRLVEVTDGADTTVATYEYDGRNYRITKGVYSSGSLTHTDHTYYNESWQALEVRREVSGTEDPDPREQYVWHPHYVDALAVRYYDADTDGILSENNDGPHYYAHGSNYHVTAVVNSSGTILERYAYTPYGQLTVLDADFTTDADGASDIDNTYAFTGRRYDAETGLHYFRARYYDGATGRFLNRDPLLYIDGHNLYAGNFVPHRVDPLGLQDEDADDPATADGGTIVLGIHSNTEPWQDFTDGHAWITVTDTGTGDTTTYGLWADSHRRTEDNGDESDVRTNLEGPYPGAHDRYYELDSAQEERLNAFLDIPDEWTAMNTCASWATNCVRYVVGEDLDAEEQFIPWVDDYTTHTPRALSARIMGMEAGDPTTPPPSLIPPPSAVDETTANTRDGTANSAEDNDDDDVPVPGQNPPPGYPNDGREWPGGPRV